VPAFGEVDRRVEANPFSAAVRNPVVNRTDEQELGEKRVAVVDVNGEEWLGR